MIYRNHIEYKVPAGDPNHDLLRGWPRGEIGVESPRKWLSTMYK